jgi:hypothetical protein
MAAALRLDLVFYVEASYAAASILLYSSSNHNWT